MYISFRDRHINLRHKYYAQKVSMHLRECDLRNKWQKFVSQSADKHIPEWIVTFMAQWCKPQEHVSHSHVVASLDNIAQQALEILQEEYPEHSIFSVSAEQVSLWKTSMHSANQWNKTETKQVLEAICKVMFQNLGFRPFTDSERTSSNYKNFIDDVSKLEYSSILSCKIVDYIVYYYACI